MARDIDSRIWFPLRLLVFLCVVAIGSAFTPCAARAIPLAGTIRYSGSRGQVSTDRPIMIGVNSDAFFNGKHGNDATVNSNGGAFQLDVPTAGDYYLVYAFLEFGDVQLGEPFEIYENRFAFPADPVHVPPSGLTGLDLEFDDTGILLGIAGTVTYTGNRGLVNKSSPLGVLAFTDPNFSIPPASGLASQSNDVENNSGSFYLATLDTNPYYLRPFFDLNGNGDLDVGEPFASCNNSVRAGRDQAGVMITFGDAGAATCIVPAAPTPTPTPSACVGDCDGSGAVTVNEIITLVNIDLGTAEASACPNGIPSGGSVDISLIIKAVNNALNGCPAPVATFTPLTATMTAPRAGHTATRLPNGQVILIGGDNLFPGTGTTFNTPELYDPTANTFTALPATMTTAREGHTATLLPNGQVLITGGFKESSGLGDFDSAELYDPGANTFTALSATMTTARSFHTGTLLNGQVLITGGANDTTGPALNTAELYGP